MLRTKIREMKEKHKPIHISLQLDPHLVFPPQLDRVDHHAILQKKLKSLPLSPCSM